MTFSCYPLLVETNVASTRAELNLVCRLSQWQDELAGLYYISSRSFRSGSSCPLTVQRHRLYDFLESEDGGLRRIAFGSLKTGNAQHMGLDTVELVMRVEKEFGIDIPNTDAARLVTVGELHGYVVDTLRQQGRIESSDSVYEHLREIICYQLGVKPEDVIPSAQFVDDLGAD